MRHGFAERRSREQVLDALRLDVADRLDPHLEALSADEHAVGAPDEVHVDLRPIEQLPETAVVTVQGNITDPCTRAHVITLCGGKADVLLSDLAPKLSGIRARDAAQAAALGECALEWARCILKPGGRLVVKLFMSDELPRYLTRLRSFFHEVHTTRPEATRKGSAEIYAIASRFRGDVTPV